MFWWRTTILVQKRVRYHPRQYHAPTREHPPVKNKANLEKNMSSITGVHLIPPDSRKPPPGGNKRKRQILITWGGFLWLGWGAGRAYLKPCDRHVGKAEQLQVIVDKLLELRGDQYLGTNLGQTSPNKGIQVNVLVDTLLKLRAALGVRAANQKGKSNR